MEYKKIDLNLENDMYKNILSFFDDITKFSKSNKIVTIDI